MRCGILVLAAVGVALSTEARAQGRITGTVTAAQDGRPIAGATVTVVGTNRTVATDASGRYEIADAPSGAQQVRVRLLGFAPLTQTAQVPAGGGGPPRLPPARARGAARGGRRLWGGA